MHSFDAATYIAIVAPPHLTPPAQILRTAMAIIRSPENSVEVFLPARGCILQPSITITREYRRHAPGRSREQEQEQALQPFQKQHFPFF